MVWVFGLANVNVALSMTAPGRLPFVVAPLPSWSVPPDIVVVPKLALPLLVSSIRPAPLFVIGELVFQVLSCPLTRRSTPLAVVPLATLNVRLFPSRLSIWALITEVAVLARVVIE